MSLAGLAAAPKRRITWSPNNQLSTPVGSSWGTDAAAAVWPGNAIPFDDPGVAAGAVPTSYTYTGKTYSALAAASALMRMRFEGATLRHRVMLLDLLWLSGYLSPTAATPITIGSPTLPARDIVASTNGVNCQLVAWGSGGSNSTVTITYTNSAGTTGRTAQAVVGNLQGGPTWFPLDTGDEGVKSVQSVVSSSTLTTLLLAIVSRVAHYSIPAASNTTVLGGRETSDLHNLHVLPAGTLLFPVWGVMGSNTSSLHGVTIDLAEV